MDALRQWSLCIIVAAAAGTLACIISPKGSLEKTVRAVVGIFVVASICAPLTQLKNVNPDEFMPVWQNYENSAGEELSEYALSACKESVGNEINRLAELYGMPIKYISVNAYTDENRCIIIHNIQVGVDCANEYDINKFSAELEKNLGLTVTVNAE